MMKALAFLLIGITVQAQPAKHPVRSSPSPVSVRPSAGASSGQTFTARFYDAKGGSHIAHAFFSVQARTPSKACAARYDPGPNRFYLLDDNGNKYLGPMDGSGEDTLHNGQCALAGSAKVSGNTLTVEFMMIFSINFSGAYGLYLSLSDTEGKASGRVLAGAWTVPYVKPGPPRIGRSRRKAGPYIPEDPVLPTPMPRLPPPITVTSTNCNDVTGTWTESTTGGAWSLVQTGKDISGSLKVTSAECGSVTWQVSGKMEGKVATLHATRPEPATDTCGVRAAASIDSTLPGCSARDGRVQVNREGKIP